MFKQGDTVIYRAGPDLNWPAMIQQVNMQTGKPIYQIVIFMRPSFMHTSAIEGKGLYEIQSRDTQNCDSNADAGRADSGNTGVDVHASVGKHTSGKDTIKRDSPTIRT